MQQQQQAQSSTQLLPSVTVTRGEHRHPIPQGLAGMMVQELAARGLTGSYNLRMGPTVLGTPSMPPLKVVRVTARGTVELRCKPGGNDSARVCWLSLPQGTATTDAVREAEALASILKTQGGNGMAKAGSAGYGFTANRSNVQDTLRVLCASGARDKWILADRAKKALMGSGVGHGLTSASWGQVLGAMGRQGLLELRRSGEALAAVKVPEKHVPREMSQANGHADNPTPASKVKVMPGMPLPSTVGREGLHAWLRQLAGIEDALLSQLVVAEEGEKQAHEVWIKAKGEADLVREQLAKAGQAVGAAKLLLEMMG